jgi:hypothetical protein
MTLFDIECDIIRKKSIIKMYDIDVYILHSEPIPKCQITVGHTYFKIPDGNYSLELEDSIVSPAKTYIPSENYNYHEIIKVIKRYNF